MGLPVMIGLVGWLDASRRPAAEEIRRGHLPLWLLAALHFALVRPIALADAAQPVLERIGVRWLWNVLGFAAASILPMRAEVLESSPFFWGPAALLAAAGLVAAARAGSGRWSYFLGVPAAGALVFLALILPSVLSFQDRYMLLPSAASAVVLAALLISASRRARAVALTLLLLIWAAALVDQWRCWMAAGQTSRSLVAGLVETSRQPGVREIVVVNLPHRVRGAPIAADFRAATIFSGGRPVEVTGAAHFDYPRAVVDALAGPAERAIRVDGSGVDVLLRVPSGSYARYLRASATPGDPDGAAAGRSAARLESPGVLRVSVPDGPGRAICLWSGGRLRRLL